MPKAKAKVQGVELHYDIAGSGEPLMLLVGQSTGPAGRDALVAALARRHAVILPDPRGGGRSAPGTGATSLATFAADAVGLLDALGIAAAHLVCHSTGCGIGHALAAGQPARVQRLVLAAPWSHADEHLVVVQELRKAAAAALSPEQYARFNAALLFPPEFRREHAAAFARVAMQAKDRPQDATAIAARLDAILAFDARGLWPSIRCPTLVMVARDDQVMPRWHGIDAAHAIAGSRLLELDGGGHMFPETRTREFVAAVLGFLGEAGTA